MRRHPKQFICRASHILSLKSTEAAILMITSTSLTRRSLSSGLIASNSFVISPSIGTILVLTISSKFYCYLAISKHWLLKISFWTLSIGLVPLLGRIRTQILLKSGMQRMNFSKTTLPTKPVQPVIRIVLSLQNSLIIFKLLNIQIHTNIFIYIKQLR